MGPLGIKYGKLKMIHLQVCNIPYMPAVVLFTYVYIKLIGK